VTYAGFKLAWAHTGAVTSPRGHANSPRRLLTVNIPDVMGKSKSSRAETTKVWANRLKCLGLTRVSQ